MHLKFICPGNGGPFDFPKHGCVSNLEVAAR